MRWPWRRRARERELAEELSAHLEMAIRQHIQRGESPEVARDNVRREFGNGLVNHVRRLFDDFGYQI